MTEDIKKKIIKEAVVLTKVTCDCCKRELGLFHLKYDEDIGYIGFKDIPNSKPVSWYSISIRDGYYTDHVKQRKLADVCPDCYPKWITEFRDKNNNSEEYIELLSEYNVEYPKLLEADTYEEENS